VQEYVSYKTLQANNNMLKTAGTMDSNAARFNLSLFIPKSDIGMWRIPQPFDLSDIPRNHSSPIR